MYMTTLVLVALSAEKVTTIYGGCVLLSLLVHYFTLVSVMWMGAEALLMFQKLVIVFVRITTKWIVSVSVICWSKSCSKLDTVMLMFYYHSTGVPIVFILVPFIVDMTNDSEITRDIIIERGTSSDDIS